jgi:hypothetical protein
MAGKNIVNPKTKGYKTFVLKNISQAKIYIV